MSGCSRPLLVLFLIHLLHSVFTPCLYLLQGGSHVEVFVTQGRDPTVDKCKFHGPQSAVKKVDTLCTFHCLILSCNHDNQATCTTYKALLHAVATLILLYACHFIRYACNESSVVWWFCSWQPSHSQSTLDGHTYIWPVHIVLLLVLVYSIFCLVPIGVW